MLLRGSAGHLWGQWAANVSSCSRPYATLRLSQLAQRQYHASSRWQFIASSGKTQQASAERTTERDAKVHSPKAEESSSSNLDEITWHGANEHGHILKQYPWLRRIRGDKHYLDDAMGRLQQELLSFEHLMRQTFNERRARLMTGSYVKSLFTKFSDLVGKVYMDPVIDIAVPHSPLVFRTPLQARPGASESFHERMEFTRRLRLQAIENALLSVNAGKTPGDEVFIRDPNATGGDGTFFLSLKHAPTGLRIVIYADRWSNEPQRAEVVKKYLRKFPALEPIYIALRTLLEMHGYFNSGNSKNPILDSAQPDKRGLDPYSLMLLIVGAMKVSKPQGGYAKDDIATPFRDVISFVATWDTAAHGLSVSPGRLFIPGSEDDPLVEGLKKKRVNRLPAAGDKGSPFCIADPVDGWRDIGKAINTSGEIQELFRATIMDMDAQLETWKSFDRIRGDDGKLISRPPIMQMLGANYRSLAQWRARLVAGAYKMEDERWSNGWKEPGRRLRTAEIKKV